MLIYIDAGLFVGTILRTRRHIVDYAINVWIIKVSTNKKMSIANCIMN